MLNRVKIDIMGTQYTVASTEDERYVRGIAAELDAQVRALMESSPKLSLNAALVLCALSCTDNLKKSEQSADHIRAQLTDYLEDSAKARLELEEAQREIERLRRKIGN